MDAHHGYPATSVQWQPASAMTKLGYGQQMGGGTELLATAGDSLRVWEYAGDGPMQNSGYVGSKSTGGHRLNLKSTLSGVRAALTIPLLCSLTIVYLTE